MTVGYQGVGGETAPKRVSVSDWRISLLIAMAATRFFAASFEGRRFFTGLAAGVTP